MYKRQLLKALISNSPVPIRAVEELPGQGRGAMFDPEQNAILVKKGMDAPDIFRCVSLEPVSYTHLKGARTMSER